jgi:NADH:quinone reductase (non-electrogenic)
VIGDAAAVKTKDRSVPGIAPAAKQMGRLAALNIKARITGGATKFFIYRHHGNLAVIGRNSAVVDLGRLRLSGFTAWLFWSAAHIFFLIGARNRIAVAFNWLWDYVTKQRSVRLIMNDRD